MSFYFGPDRLIRYPGWLTQDSIMFISIHAPNNEMAEIGDADSYLASLSLILRFQDKFS